MSEIKSIEMGKMGRVAYARIAPNEDLVNAVENLCLASEFKNAFVRGALGSLNDACLEQRNGKIIQVGGPAVEIVSIAGEIKSVNNETLKADLTGVVADPKGVVYGGYFVAGANPICMTVEITLEEWLPE